MSALVETQPFETRTTAPATTGTRWISVDALRGFDMFWIIGGDYLVRALPRLHDSALTRGLAEQMEHCEWAGFHFYDLIFPLFVFLAGVSLAFSARRMLERDGRAATLRRVCFRSLLLFLLGVFYMGGVGNGFKNIYFAGVLHRIAVAYFFAGLIFCFCRARTMGVLCVALLAGYWVLMTWVPVPGVGTPTLAEPGKNFAHYLDERFLPGRKFEGTVLSTMAAVANCLLGVFAGMLIEKKEVRPEAKPVWLAVAGIASLGLGLLWSLSFPIIKLLWTSSYVLVSCGIGAVLLAASFQVIEIWKIQKWAQPLVWIGTNAITIYLLGNMVNFHQLARRFVGGDMGVILGVWAEFAQALVTILMGIWIVRFLYGRRIFLRL